MDLIIKCSGDCSNMGTAYGFTVRYGQRIVHRESGVLAREVAACADAAKHEAIRRAIAWLLTKSVNVGRVSIRYDGPKAEWAPLLAELRRRGWAAEPELVSPELVSEAAALSRQTAVAAARTRGVGRHVVWQRAARQVASCTALPVLPLRTALAQRPSGDAADAIIICDGGYKPPPYGIATYACLVWAGVQLAHRESGVVCWGRAAGSHVAELAAAVAALRWLAASPLADGARVELRSDNQWVVNTLTGHLRCRPLPGTVMLLRTVDRLMARLSRSGCKVAIWKVPRKQVAQADALCRKVYRERLDRAGARISRQPLKAFLRPASTEWQSRV